MHVHEFQALLAEKTGVTPAAQEVLTGFPPKLLQAGTAARRVPIPHPSHTHAHTRTQAQTRTHASTNAYMLTRACTRTHNMPAPGASCSICTCNWAG